MRVIQRRLGLADPDGRGVLERPPPPRPPQLDCRPRRGQRLTNARAAPETIGYGRHRRCDHGRHESHLAPGRRDHRVGDARGRRQGQGAAGRGRGRHRLRRGRARLPDAGAHRGGGRGGVRRPAQPPATRRRRASPSSAHAIAAKTARDSGLRRRAAQVRGDQRRQARGLQRVPGAARPGRRGAPPRAVLDHLSRGGRSSPTACRSRCSHHRGRRVPGHRRAARGRAHARAPRRCCSCRRATRPARCIRRAEVEAIGRWAVEHGIWVLTDEIYEHLTYGDHVFTSMPVVVPELADTLRRAQRRRQDLRDDGLARRLDDRPRRLHRGRDQPPVAPDVQRRRREPARRARGGARRPRRGRARCAPRSSAAAA